MYRLSKSYIDRFKTGELIISEQNTSMSDFQTTQSADAGECIWTQILILIQINGLLYIH